eukprot:TRINITY_DN34629_c0_g1_i1.p2 TRINITY_DN34629_c0_g1~~TRINITY_DN34629_c0_g1_i1.p2  ORF type:complete len:122 (+),score=23.92 TRINITY_DN34629_c0_g1_i1:38-367(+)
MGMTLRGRQLILSLAVCIALRCVPSARQQVVFIAGSRITTMTSTTFSQRIRTLSSKATSAKEDGVKSPTDVTADASQPSALMPFVVLGVTVIGGAVAFYVKLQMCGMLP